MLRGGMLEVADTLPEVNISEHLNILKPYYWYHSVLLKLWLCISGDTDGGLGRWLHDTMLDTMHDTMHDTMLAWLPSPLSLQVLP